MQTENNKKQIIVNGQCEWLNQPSPFFDMDASWIKIIVFYLFHTPVDGVSARGKMLTAFRWGEKSKTADYKELKKRLIDYSDCLDKSSFVCVDSYDDLRKELHNTEMYHFPNRLSDARVVFRKTKSGENESLLVHIRNALAHGRIAEHQEKGIIYVILEDLEKHNVVSARMIIPKRTLTRWIEIIQAGPFVSNEELKQMFNLSAAEMVL